MCSTLFIDNQHFCIRLSLPLSLNQLCYSLFQGLRMDNHSKWRSDQITYFINLNVLSPCKLFTWGVPTANHLPPSFQIIFFQTLISDIFLNTSISLLFASFLAVPLQHPSTILSLYMIKVPQSGPSKFISKTSVCAVSLMHSFLLLSILATGSLQLYV